MENELRRGSYCPLARIVGLCSVLDLPGYIGAWLGSSVYLETTLEARPGWLLVQITAMTLHLDDSLQDGLSRRSNRHVFAYTDAECRPLYSSFYK
jgi:hypothetical protein